MLYDRKTALHLSQIARSAGERIMAHYAGPRTARKKEDHSPVTEADIEANSLIVAALTQDFHGIPVVSEENTVQPALAGNGAAFFLVDPLDGTRSFVSGEGEFTVNIGLIKGGIPVLGVVYAPAMGVLYAGGANIGCWREQGDEEAVPIHCRPRPEREIIVTRSRSHPSARTNEFMEKFSVGEIRPASGAIKFCWVAEGSADLYPRFGQTMEWDTAAGHAILNEAGGKITDLEGNILAYAKPEFRNEGFIAWGPQ